MCDSFLLLVMLTEERIETLLRILLLLLLFLLLLPLFVKNFFLESKKIKRFVLLCVFDSLSFLSFPVTTLNSCIVLVLNSIAIHFKKKKWWERVAKVL